MDCSHTLSRWQPQVRVAYDYYPFGLTWHNPAAADTPEGRHDHAYQDKEFQWNEFGAGAGMALYDFHARMYDPATATWSVPDPAEQFANPYLAMGNNPVVGVDPDGRFVLSAIIVGTLVGSYVGAALAAGADNNVGFDANPFDGSWKGTDWYKGAVVGGFAGAGAGLGLSFIAVGASAASSSSVAIGAAYKGIIGSNMGIVSNALSGGGLDGMFSGALIGAAAGFTSGMLMSTSFASKASIVLKTNESKLSVGIYNVLYGMSDGAVKSMAQDEPWYDVALSAMLGAADGVVSTLVMSASTSLPGPMAQHASMMATGFRGLGISLPETVIYGLTSVVASPTRLWGFRSGQELGNWWYGRASVAYDRELSILQIEDLIKLLLNENSN
jgi:RHS repeat-associated protein